MHHAPAWCLRKKLRIFSQFFSQKNWISVVGARAARARGSRTSTVRTVYYSGAFSKLLKSSVQKLNFFNFWTKISRENFYCLKGFSIKNDTPYKTICAPSIGPRNGQIPFVCKWSSLRSAQAFPSFYLHLLDSI